MASEANQPPSRIASIYILLHKKQIVTLDQFIHDIYLDFFLDQLKLGKSKTTEQTAQFVLRLKSTQKGLLDVVENMY